MHDAQTHIPICSISPIQIYVIHTESSRVLQTHPTHAAACSLESSQPAVPLTIYSSHSFSQPDPLRIYPVRRASPGSHDSNSRGSFGPSSLKSCDHTDLVVLHSLAEVNLPNDPALIKDRINRVNDALI